MVFEIICAHHIPRHMSWNQPSVRRMDAPDNFLSWIMSSTPLGLKAVLCTLQTQQ